MLCVTCRQPLKDGAYLCSQCGAAQPMPEPKPASPIWRVLAALLALWVAWRMLAGRPVSGYQRVLVADLAAQPALYDAKKVSFTGFVGGGAPDGIHVSGNFVGGGSVWVGGRGLSPELKESLMATLAQRHRVYVKGVFHPAWRGSTGVGPRVEAQWIADLGPDRSAGRREASWSEQALGEREDAFLRGAASRGYSAVTAADLAAQPSRYGGRKVAFSGFYEGNFYAASDLDRFDVSGKFAAGGRVRVNGARLSSQARRELLASLAPFHRVAVKGTFAADPGREQLLADEVADIGRWNGVVSEPPSPPAGEARAAEDAFFQESAARGCARILVADLEADPGRFDSAKVALSGVWAGSDVDKFVVHGKYYGGGTVGALGTALSSESKRSLLASLGHGHRVLLRGVFHAGRRGFSEYPEGNGWVNAEKLLDAGPVDQATRAEWSRASPAQLEGTLAAEHKALEKARREGYESVSIEGLNAEKARFSARRVAVSGFYGTFAAQDAGDLDHFNLWNKASGAGVQMMDVNGSGVPWDPARRRELLLSLDHSHKLLVKGTFFADKVVPYSRGTIQVTKLDAAEVIDLGKANTE